MLAARAVVVYVALLALAAAAPIRVLPSVSCVDSAISLTVKATRVTIPAADGTPAFVSFNTRLYHLNNVAQYPGPTVRMKAGHTCSFTIVNQLPALNPAEGCSGSIHGAGMNMMHCADVTNVSRETTLLAPSALPRFALASRCRPSSSVDVDSCVL